MGAVRVPVVTVVVFVLTASCNVLQFFVDGMLDAMAREPSGLHGQWWRLGTALLVQDGGVIGTVSNLVFLLAIGALAERVLSAWRWLGCYLGAGLVGELAGYAWQPHGAGNSIAICGLAGALLVALSVGDRRVAHGTSMVLLYWCGALLSLVIWPALVVFVLAGMAAQVAERRGRPVGRLVAAAGGIATVALLAETDIHGAALAAGVAFGVLFALLDRAGPAAARPRRSLEGAHEP